MADTKRQIADKVRGLMAEKRSSQKAIAELLGLSRQAVSARFTYRAPWQAHEVLALAAHWQVPVTRFFPDSSERLAVAS